MKKVKSIVKRIAKSYINGVNQLYAPCINNGINPFM